MRPNIITVLKMLHNLWIKCSGCVLWLRSHSLPKLLTPSHSSMQHLLGLPTEPTPVQLQLFVLPLSLVFVSSAVAAAAAATSGHGQASLCWTWNLIYLLHCCCHCGAFQTKSPSQIISRNNLCELCPMTSSAWFDDSDVSAKTLTARSDACQI
jgi:hypothetical protein